MIKRYEETITNTYNENNELIETVTVRTPILIPEENEVIRNKCTDEIIEGEVGVGTDDSEDNYEVLIKID